LKLHVLHVMLQVALLESELTSLVSSNQQLRAQLEANSQQLARLTREKVAAQEAAGEAVEKLQPQLRKLADEGAEAKAAAEAERMQKEEAEQLKGEVQN
jgi:hypothetical protein